MTEPLQPYQPAHSAGYEDQDEYYDWEYDQQPRERPKVLWGRIAILGGLVLVAFLLGRVTKSGGIPQERLDQANAEAAELQQQVDDLETELAAQPPITDPELGTDTESDAGTEDEGAAGTTETGTESETYIVERGDTLTTIAEDFYGDASLDDFLAEANNISDPAALSVGQEIIIPEEPTE